jgi:integrase
VARGVGDYLRASVCSVRKGGKLGERLTAHSVAEIIKIHAERVGLDPALFSGHSLRAGFLTSAAKRGASIFKMMDVSRHKSVDTLRGYVRDAELFQDHAGAGLLWGERAVWRSSRSESARKGDITSLPCLTDRPCCPHWPRIC